MNNASNKFKEEGNKLFMKRNYKEAIEMYTKALEKSINSINYTNRALCYSKSHQDRHGQESARDTIMVLKINKLLRSIFSPEKLVEKCIERNPPMFSNFVDLRKDFDNIHRDTLWVVMRHNVILKKIVSLIKLFYERFECGVILTFRFFYKNQTRLQQL